MEKTGLSKGERRIRAAFVDLLEEKGFYQIKVSEILARADVSRATFYAYYEDKYQLVRILRQELFDSLGQMMDRVRQTNRKDGILQWTGSTSPHFMEYFRCIQENRRLWTIFFSGKGEGDFSTQLSQYLYRWIFDTQVKWQADGDPELPLEHRAVICAWAYVALFSYWVNTDMEDSVERMAKTMTVFWTRFMGWDH